MEGSLRQLAVTDLFVPAHKRAEVCALPHRALLLPSWKSPMGFAR